MLAPRAIHTGLLTNDTGPHDGPLFSAVSKRFWREVEAYGATREACWNVCPMGEF